MSYSCCLALQWAIIDWYTYCYTYKEYQWQSQRLIPIMWCNKHRYDFVHFLIFCTLFQASGILPKYCKALRCHIIYLEYIWYVFPSMLQIGEHISWGTAFPTRLHVCPAKTLVSLCIHAVCLKMLWTLGYPQDTLQRCWSDCKDVQADLSLRWAHMQSCS